MGNFDARIRATLSKRAIYGIIVLLIFGIALTLRVCLPYDSVFVGDSVRFAGNDPWYQMRLVENLVQNFPHLIEFDPFTLYPYGLEVPFAPFFDLMLGFFIWVIGMGSPTQHTIETVGAYFPAVLGALVTIPVYFISRELFNRNVGLLSAVIIAILPGQFLFRSLLGFTDHHIVEVLFTIVAALFLILAIKRARWREISFNHIRIRDWANLKSTLLYALLAGIALGLYLASWVGGLLFVFVIFAYLVVQYIVDHLKGKSTDYLCIIGVPMFILTFVLVIPFLNRLSYGGHGIGGLVVASLSIGILALPVLGVISRVMASRRVRRAYYPLSLATLGLVAVGVFYAVDPSLLHSMLAKFGIFAPSARAATISEVQTGLSLVGFLRILYYFTTTIFLALTALVLLIRAQVKHVSADKVFLIVWSIIMLLAMLGQNRFSYYFAVNVALLSGYLCWRILVWGYSIKTGPKREKGEMGVMGEVTQFLGAFYPKVEAILTGGHLTRHTRMAGVAVMVFLIAIFPNIMVSADVASETEGPNEAWYSSLVWMRENTPDPFQDPGFYYELYEEPPSGRSYDYPESAYGVMNWWDYGHWITYIAHRIPNSNPFQSGVPGVAKFFTAQNESSANEVMDKLGSKYVILDYDMANGKLSAMGLWAGENESYFMEYYDIDPDEGEYERGMLYYPEYYRSMCSRLYNFDGEAVVPHNSTMVVSYEEVRLGLTHIKQITSSETFTTYEEAVEYLGSQNTTNFKIVGEDPSISPVPLEKLEHYNLVYQSDPVVIEVTTGIGEEEEEEEQQLFYVKIFEYQP